MSPSDPRTDDEAADTPADAAPTPDDDDDGDSDYHNAGGPND